MRILLIEDYQPLKKSLTKGLAEAGFSVDAASDGPEGLWHALSNDYDVIVLDLMLPGMDGLSILKRLRLEHKKSHVLILTARDAVEDRIKGLDAGADDYLVKPFAFGELIARIRALVRRKYMHKNPVLSVSDVKIDTSARRVWKAGSEVTLTAREYKLLEYLAMRAGQVVSRTDIWQHIYEFNSDASSNVVDVYVGYLRKKIDKNASVPLLRTVRGHGYRFGNETDAIA